MTRSISLLILSDSSSPLKLIEGKSSMIVRKAVSISEYGRLVTMNFIPVFV